MKNFIKKQKLLLTIIIIFLLAMSSLVFAQESDDEEIYSPLEIYTPFPNNSSETEDTDSSQDYEDLEDTVCVHVFLDEECPDCTEIKFYLENLDREDVNFLFYDVTDESDAELYESFKNMYTITFAGYPVMFIGDTFLVGQTAIKENIEKILDDCKEKGCPCPVEKIKGTTPTIPKKDYKPESGEVLNLPLVGEINIEGMPLYVMTALIAFIDGFNPCSLWVLTFLLGIVIYTGSRKKIFIVGITFLLVTATAYGAFILGLLNVFAYVGYLLWIKILVALIALLFAVVNIKDYFWYKKGLSFTISDKHKPSLFKKIRNIMHPSQSLGGMIVATIIMALGIVLVELPCTAGFPMIWSNIIAQNEVVGGQFMYLFLLYIFIYLLIELVIFFSAVITLKAGKFQEKHGRTLKLVGGMIMLALAITMVFFPDAMNSITGSIYIFGLAGLASYLIILVHKRVLPRYGIYIGTGLKDKKTKNKDKQEDDKK